MGKIKGVMVMVNFFDHRPWGKFQGVMVMVSALPPPPKSVGHVLTGDLDIVKNRKLKKLFKQGYKFIEPL